MPDPDWKHFYECALFMTERAKSRKSQTIASSSSSSTIPKFNKDVVWFVAADTAAARLRVQQTFNASGAEILFYGDEFQVSNNPAGVQNAFVDLLMLVQADARVLSVGSSYSEFAHTMAGG
jgi:hypothetical protein